MRKINQILDKLFSTIPGYIFGLLAFIIGFLGDVVALSLSPNYQMWRSSISLLGLNPGGIFWRIGLIFSNICAIPFVVYFGRVLKDDSINEIVRKLAIGLGIFTSTSAILTGIFVGRTELFIYLHGIFALLSFIGGASVCSIYTFLVSKNPKFSKSIMYTGIVISVIAVSYLIPFFITNFCSLFMNICYTFGQNVYIIMPVYEWTMILAILTWYLSNSIYMLKIKHH
jgi:hypothetical protein